MNAIRPYIKVAVWVGVVVWLLWLVFGGLFSSISSITPLAWMIVLMAVIVGIVALAVNYGAEKVRQLGENELVWGVFQTIVVVGFVFLFIQAVLWVNSNEFLIWMGIDVSPRVRMFMSVVVVSLCLFPLPPLIDWIIETKGIFAKAVWRTLFATSFLLLAASLFLPKMFFDPKTGKAIATIDSEGNTFYDPAKKFSPATRDELKPITPEQAKKIKPWWEQGLSAFQKWNNGRKTAAEKVRQEAEKARPLTHTPSPPSLAKNPDCTYVQRADGRISGDQAIRTLYVANRCEEFFFEQHTYEADVRFENNPCSLLASWGVPSGKTPLFQAVSGSPQLWGFVDSPGIVEGSQWGWINLDKNGTRVLWKGYVRVQKAQMSLSRAVTKLSCVS